MGLGKVQCTWSLHDPLKMGPFLKGQKEAPGTRLTLSLTAIGLDL